MKNKAFWLGLLANALSALRQDEPWLKMLGAASIFTLAALALMAFTQDSFAMPELWVNLGILCGTSYQLSVSSNQFE